MQDPEQYEPYPQEEFYEPPQPERRRISGWLIALIVILVLVVVCCFCAFLGLLFWAPTAGTVFSTIIMTVEVVTPVP